MNDRIFIIAGEVSGDGLAAELMSSIKQKSDVTFYGYGGVKMREQGLISTVKDNSLSSAVDYFYSLSFMHNYLYIYNRMIQDIKDSKCKHIILVDHKVFNIISVRRIRKELGDTVKVYYYIAPRLSMWKEKAAISIIDHCDAMFCYMKPDLPIYQRYTKNSYYFGNPLAKKLKTFVKDPKFFDKHNLNQNLQYMALLPGSRKHEIKKLLPTFLEAAMRLHIEKNIHFLINVAHQGLKAPITQAINKANMQNCVHIVEDTGLNIMSHCSFGFVGLGTATLESVMMGMYPIMAYKVSDMTFYIGKKTEALSNLALLGLPNIFLQQRIFPELLQFEVTSERLYQESIYFLDMNPELKKYIMTNAIERLDDFLGSIDSVEQVADYILNDMKG